MDKKNFKSFNVEEYNEIKTNENLEKFLDEVGNFHDSLIKEVHIINNAFIYDDGAMNYNFNLNMRILIQSQWIGNIELMLEKVDKLEIKNDYSEIHGSSGILKKNKLTEEQEVELSLDTNKIKCRRIFYKIYKCKEASWEPIFGEEIIADKLENLEIIDKYAICPNCLNSWEFNRREIIKCPKCFKSFRINNKI